MPRATVAQAVVAWLANQHVERDGHRQRFFDGVFGIFGHGNVAGMGEALEAAQDQVRYFQCRNEQAMVHTAAAYAKQSRRLRTFACTTSIGPGATNLVTGAANATVNRLPVLLLPGDRFATRRVRPVLQQLERPEAGDVSVNDALRPVSRYFDRIERPEMLVDALPAAMRVLTSPAETGAVTLALPQDVQAEAADWPDELFAARTWTIPRARPDAALVSRAVEAIMAARAAHAGGGRRGHLQRCQCRPRYLRAALRHPCHRDPGGQGRAALGPRAPDGRPGMSAGGSAGNAVARDADLVIAVGTRLSDFPTMSWSAWQHEGVAFVAINVAELDAAKAGALPLVGDARVVLEEIGTVLAARGWQGASADRRARLGSIRTAWNEEVDRVRHLVAAEHVSQPEAIRLVNEAAGADGVLVCAAGGLPGDLHKIWRASGPETYHLEYGYSTMGYEIAGGLGVAMAEPGAPGLRHGRRRVLPHARERDRHRLPGRHRDDDRAARQPRLPLHPQPLDRVRRRQPVQRLPPP